MNKEYREEMRNIRKEGTWTFFSFYPSVILVVFLIALTGFILSSLGLIGSTIVERKVFENSYQYTEARKTETLVFEAQLVEIERRLSNTELNKTQRSNLEAAAAGLRIQLSVSKNK